VFQSFQLQLFDLIHLAYLTIKTPEPITENPDEPVISTNLFLALRLVASREGIPLTVVPELPEITDEIALGKKNIKSSKIYDIYFESWNSQYSIVYGVEAKVLIENDCMGRDAATLIREYVSNAGMGKYINGIYRQRGCMLGYIIEGKIPYIIQKINARIQKVMAASQCLVPVYLLESQPLEIYKSRHDGKLDYDLFHLMLDFN
jgi:hypothetical protein